MPLMTDATRVFLTKEQAISLMNVQDDGSVHTQKQSGMMFLGCDWSGESVDEALDNARIIEIGGAHCKALGHGIVVIPKDAKYHSEIIFFEHDKKKLETYEKSINTPTP